MTRQLVTRWCSTHSQEYQRRCNKCNNDAVTAWRKRAKVKAVEYKGGKCERCGYNKCINALEFHHVDPSQKDFSFSGGYNIRAWSRIQPELDKCIMVCANCHRELHAEMRE